MDRLISEKVFYRATIALIIGMPVIELITGIIYRFDNNMIPSSIEPLYMSLFGVLGTVLTAIYGADSLMRKRKIRTADFFYITLLLFMIISAVFSRNPGVYSGGDSLRCENPLHFLAYYWLFFAGSLIDTPRYRRNILLSFTGVALLEGIFAFLQTFNIELTYSWLYRADRAAYGLTQNSNYYGCLSVLFVACISGLFIFYDEILSSRYLKYTLPPTAAFVFYTMLGSRARLAWVGFAALVVFYIISFAVMAKNKKDIKPFAKRALILLGCFFAVSFIAFFFTDYIREVTVRSYWEVANGDTDMMGSQRIYVWKWGLKSVPDNWLTGVGLDNYGYVFDSSPDFVEGMYMKDKAHNEYLHILVTQGIPALINYFALLIFTASGAVKSVINEQSKERRSLTWILLGMFITYAASAFFNNSIIYVAMNFWLVIGLLIPRSDFKLPKGKQP